MVSFLLLVRRAFRSLWENAYLNSVATGVIAASMLLVGAFFTIQYNLHALVDTWERDIHISAYFERDVSNDRRFEVRDEVGAMAAVSRVRYVSEQDARNYLAERVDNVAPVLQELGATALPASLEITLESEATTPARIDAFVSALESFPFKDIDYGREWVERFNSFLGLMELLGAVLGLLILLSGLFLVTNTIQLVVYNRRDELETQKLVGATYGFITLPFIIEGSIQGMIGSVLAVAGLWGVHHLLVVRLRDALHLSVAGELMFLPMEYQSMLCAGGIFIGVLAALVSVRRFLASAP